MTNEQTATVRYVHVVLQHLKRQGVRRSEFLSGLSIPVDFMQNQTTRLPVTHIEHIWQQASEQLQQPDLGLRMAADLVLTDYGLMAHYWMNCRTLWEAFRVSRDNEKLLHTGMRGQWQESDTSNTHAPVISYINNLNASTPWLTSAFIEFDFLSILRIGQQLVSPEFHQSVHFTQVNFCHEPNAPQAKYQELFNCPVQFNAPRNEILVHRHQFDLPVHAPDPVVKELISNSVTELIQKTVHISVSAKVEDILQQGLQQQQEMKLPDVAALLTISQSTLKRKIQEEGNSFSDIDKKVKLSVAKQLIYENRLSIEQIAAFLHYNDSTSFHRAFKSWTGQTPTQFRQQKNDATHEPDS